MGSESEWDLIETSSEDVEKWVHENSDNYVLVKEFRGEPEAKTWDAFLNDRLIENFDSREAALDKAEDIREEGDESFSRCWE